MIPLGKDKVDFLKRAMRSFGIEEIDEGDETGVDSSKEEIRAPADVGHHDRGDHYDEEIDAPIDNVGQCRTLGTNAQRIDFCGIKPWYSQVRCSEKRNISKYWSVLAQMKRKVCPVTHRKRPNAAPSAALGLPGIRHPKVMIMETIWPAVPIRKSLRRPRDSTVQKETSEKVAYTIMLTPPSNKDVSLDLCSEDSKRIGK